MNIFLVLYFVFGMLVTVLVTPYCIRFAKRYKLVDDPKKHKHPAIIHTYPIPRAGGLPIYLAFALGILLFFPIQQSIFLSILLAGFLVVATGLLDDKYDLSPYIRFGINILCAGIVVFAGLNLPYITNPLGGIIHFPEIHIFTLVIPLSALFAIAWIVWIMNMLNWSKGVDGQMPGVAAIACMIIGIASLRFQTLDHMNIYASHMAFLIAGTSVGFLLYNFYPAKIFPGYSSTILGFLIAILSLLSSVKLATALLVLGIPAVDFLFTFFRRILSKKSPFWHDRQHLHHLLLKKGWGQRRIAIFYWFMSLVLGMIALNVSSRGKVFAIILVLVVGGGFITTLRFLTKNRENG